MNRPRAIKIVCLSLTGLVLVLVAIALITFVQIKPPPGKYDPPETPVLPAEIPVELAIRLQLESHTCGLRSLESIYIAYGIVPDQADVRFRLGVDRPALPLSPDSKGTLHPDLLRVLAQDGFATAIVDLDAATAAEAVLAHLEGGHPVLALTQREVSGGLHWVVLSRADGRQITIIDSLEDEPLTKSLDGCLEISLSLLCVSPSSDAPPPISEVHGEGIAEMRAVLRRMGE